MKNKRLKLAKNGCDIAELTFPLMLRSDVLKQVFKKNRCEIGTLIFYSRKNYKEENLDKLITYLASNSSVTQVVLRHYDRNLKKKKSFRVFTSDMTRVIKALINNIKIIKLENFKSLSKPSLAQFFYSLKEIDCKIELENCKFSADISLAYACCKKNQPTIVLSNQRHVDRFIAALLEHDPVTYGTIKHVELQNLKFSIEQWKILLSLTKVEKFSIYKCSMDQKTWQGISEELTLNQYIKTLELTSYWSEAITDTQAAHLLENNRYLTDFRPTTINGQSRIRTLYQLAEALKVNTTLTSLTLTVGFDYKCLANILKHNKTLKTLQLELRQWIAYDDPFDQFIDALSNNTTLTALKGCIFDKCDTKIYQGLLDALTVNTTLLEVDVLKDNELAQELLACNRHLKWRGLWFIHMIKRNTHLLDLLPLELWLIIIGYFKLPELTAKLLDLLQ